MKHFASVIVDSDGTTLTLTIRCQQCGESVFKTAVAHLETLARILPRIAQEQGIDLDVAKTETFVFQAETRAEAQAKADEMLVEFIRRRTQGK